MVELHLTVLVRHGRGVVLGLWTRRGYLELSTSEHTIGGSCRTSDRCVDFTTNITLESRPPPRTQVRTDPVIAPSLPDHLFHAT